MADMPSEVKVGLCNTFFYHGTCREKWSQLFAHDTWLYLTSEPSIADHYAKEWAEEGLSPVILRFSLSDLMQAALEFQPNWENVEQAENGLWGERSMTTWEDTLNASGTFCVFGNIESVKPMAEICEQGYDMSESGSNSDKSEPVPCNSEAKYSVVEPNSHAGFGN